VLSIEGAFPNRLCAILETDDPDIGFQACLAATEGGVGSIEITTSMPSCFDLIRGLRATTGGRHPIGAGSVWDPGAVVDAKEAGAAFVVSSVLLPEVAEACRQQDILCVLSAMTPTEIYHARLAGAKLVKVFPIGPLGGPRYIQALNGAMGGVPFWVSGGVEVADVRGYLEVGVKVVGLTSALFPPDALARREFDVVRQRSEEAARAAAAV
jgi:2-dehydro-3-deoxyphosphogluconate aldolase/(4S)-4-hydroxy-2-oxoglutarate aldolase